MPGELLCSVGQLEDRKEDAQYVAPSWSWASNTGAISKYLVTRVHTLFSLDLVDSRIELTGPRLFGQVSGRNLTLKASKTVALLATINVASAAPSSVLFSDEEHKVDIWWDVPVAKLVKDNDRNNLLMKTVVLYLLPTNFAYYSGTIERLVLNRMHDLFCSSSFTRLGKFKLRIADTEEYLNLARRVAMDRALENELKCKDEPPGKLQRYVVTLI